MPASNQPKMKTAYKLFPKKIMLVPYEEIVGESPSIGSFADIDETNAIIINDFDSISEISIHEDGVEVQFTKEGENIQQLDAGGIGDIDNITTSRQGSVSINVNGINHDLIAIKDGLNPFNAISENTRFSKNGKIGLAKSIEISSQGDLDLEDGTDIPLTVNDSATEGLGLDATVDVVNGEFANTTIVAPGSDYDVAPIVTLLETETGLIDIVHATGTISEPDFQAVPLTAGGDITFTFGTEDLAVSLQVGDNLLDIYDRIKDASKNSSSFPVVIDLENGTTRAKFPGVAYEGDLTFVDTDQISVVFLDTPVSTLAQDFSSLPTFNAVIEQGVASSGVIRKGSITKQKWAIFFISELSDETDLFYSAVPRSVITDDDPIDTSMKGEKKVCVLNFSGLKIPSTSELNKFQEAITPIISDKYNMIFSWNAKDEPYTEA